MRDLEAVYNGRELLFEAERRLAPWEKHGRKEISEVATATHDAVKNLLAAQNLFEGVFKGSSKDHEADIALAGAKLRTGRNGILESALGLSTRILADVSEGQMSTAPPQFIIDEGRLAQIVSYIDNNFDEGLALYDKGRHDKATGAVDAYTLTEETWAAIFVRNYISYGQFLPEQQSNETHSIAPSSTSVRK